MTPIYFPFTWMDADTIQAITAVFSKFVVYRPSTGKTPSFFHPFEQNGMLEILTPVADDGDHIEKVAADYQNWAKLHQGCDLGFLKSRQPEAPFTDSLSSSIQSEILHYREPSASTPQETLTNARLFLEVAAAYDRQQSEIDCQLEGIQDIEKRFMTATGNVSEQAGISLGNLPLSTDDPGDFMTRERLQAWAILALQDHRQRMPDDPLITSSPAIIRWIQDIFQVEKVMQIDAIPQTPHPDIDTKLWQEAISNYIREIQTRSWPFAIRTFEPPSSEYAIENAVSVKAFITVNQSSDNVLQQLAMRPYDNAVMSGNTRHGVIIQVDSCGCVIGRG